MIHDFEVSDDSFWLKIWIPRFPVPFQPPRPQEESLEETARQNPTESSRFDPVDSSGPSRIDDLYEPRKA